MLRFTTCLLVALFVLAAMIGIGLISQPMTAQDQTEERLSALETRVAVLEERLDTLAPEEAASTATPTATDRDRGETLEISGTGSMVTDDFFLEAGRYQVTLDVASGCCIILTIYGPSGSDALLFGEIFPGDQGGTVTDIYQVRESGLYFIDAQNTRAPWSVTFEPR